MVLVEVLVPGYIDDRHMENIHSEKGLAGYWIIHKLTTIYFDNQFIILIISQTYNFYTSFSNVKIGNVSLLNMILNK